MYINMQMNMRLIEYVYEYVGIGVSGNLHGKIVY